MSWKDDKRAERREAWAREQQAREEAQQELESLPWPEQVEACDDLAELKEVLVRFLREHSA